MYGYIYKTTNLVNGKIYIGQKHSRKFLGNKYLGSGLYLKKAIKKYGKGAFNVELLEEVESKELMDEREIYWIKYYMATDDTIGYNISEGGRVNRTMVGKHNPMFNKTHSDETRAFLSQINKGVKKSQEFRDSRSNYMRGKHWYNNGTIESYYLDSQVPDGWVMGRLPGKKRKQHSQETKQKISNSLKGKSLTTATKQKISRANKGRVWVNNGIEELILCIEDIPEGWIKGRLPEHNLKIGKSQVGKKLSEETKQKISNSTTIRLLHEYELGIRKSTGKNNGMYGKHHSDSTKSKIGKANSTLWFTNGKEDIKVAFEDTQAYIELGYRRGRTFAKGKN